MRRPLIFSGSSHPLMVDAICERLGQKPAKADLKKFSCGETSVEIHTSVRDQDVFIVQSGSGQINDNVMELLVMINACRGGSAKSITAVMPYFPYSRQSKKKSHRGAITARMLANLMKVAGVDHVITVDLHASQMQGFFKCPVDNLVAEQLLARWIKTNVPEWQEAVVVSKNPGGTKRVTSLADCLKLSFGIVTTDSRRSYISPSTVNSVILEKPGTSQSQHAAGNDTPFASSHSAGAPVEYDFAIRHATQRSRGNTLEDGQSIRNGHRPSPTSSTTSSGIRNRTTNGALPLSPLSKSMRQESVGQREDTAPPNLEAALGEAADPVRGHDGYEDSDDDDEADERARDVIRGRLISGHIVEDDVLSTLSPSISARSASPSGHPSGQRHSSDDEPPEHMFSSFISTTSSRARGHGLGGTGDATASDEEEEEALQNPEIETTVTLVGNVREKPVLIVDDMIDKAGSWIAAAETVVKRGGATKVYCMATHGLFGGDSLRELEMCDEIGAVIVTDAFPIPDEKRRGISKLVVLDISGLVAEAIRRNHHGESLRQLYQYFE